MKKIISIVAIAAVIAGKAALAQPTPMANPTVQPGPSTTGPSILSQTPVAEPKITALEVNALTLSPSEAYALEGRAVYSNSKQKVGEIAGFTRGLDGRVLEMHVGIGGFLGFGETYVRVKPTEFRLTDGQFILGVSATQAKALPIVK